MCVPDLVFGPAGLWHDASSAWPPAAAPAWAWSMPGSSGTLTVPAGKDDEWADDIWLEVFRAVRRVDRRRHERAARGLQSAPGDDVRTGDAPGGEWVRYVSPRFGVD